MVVVRNSTSKWTPERDAKLMGLFDYGLRATDVAEQMGITICAAEGRYRRLKKAQQNDG